MDSDISQLGIKDIAEAYVRLEERTQFLTKIQRYVGGKKRNVFLQQKKDSAEIQEWFQLIVEITYLMYTSYLTNIPILVSNDIFEIQKGANREVLKSYLIERDFLEVKGSQKEFIAANYTFLDGKKHLNAFPSCFRTIMIKILDLMQIAFSNIIDKKNKKAQIPRNQFLQFRQFVYKNEIESTTPQEMIRQVEKTSLFEMNSNLLKVLNCSLFMSISIKQKRQTILQQVCKQQNILRESFKIMLKSKQIDHNIILHHLQSFFNFLMTEEVIHVYVSFNSNNSASDKSKVINSLSQKSKTHEGVTTWKIKVKEKSGKFLNSEIDEIGEESQKSSQFIVQYASLRSLLTIKYICQLEINMDNIDNLMLYCNSMVSNWYNASAEEMQREIKTNSNSVTKQRLLTFKINSLLNFKEDPYRSILLFIDLAMVYGKLSQKQISRFQIKPTLALNTVDKKLSHYGKMFMNKKKTVYDYYEIPEVY